MKLTRKQILRLFDFLIARTLHLGTSLSSRVEEALKYGDSLVELLPFQITKIPEIVKKHRVKFSLLVGYPLGVSSVEGKCLEIRRGERAGVDEIVLMPNLSNLKSSFYEEIEKEINIIRSCTGLPVKIAVSDLLLSKEEYEKLAEITERNNIILISQYEDIEVEKTVSLAKFVKTGNLKNKNIRIKLRGKEIEEFNMIPDQSLLGGRNFSSRYLFDTHTYEYDAFDPLNKVIFSPGSLASTGLSCTSHITVAFISPLSEGLRSIELMGDCGKSLSDIGIRSLILEETSEEPVVIHVNPSRIEIIPASQYSGLTTSAFFRQLKAHFGENTSLILTGPSSEEKLLSSTIIATDSSGKLNVLPSRGSGIGSVFGSKNVRAIIIEKRKAGGKYSKATNDSFNIFEELLIENTVTGRTLPEFSTLGFFQVNNILGSLPVNNFSVSTIPLKEAENVVNTFKKDYNFSGRCQNCVIRCFNRSKESGRNIDYDHYSGLALINGMFLPSEFECLYDFCFEEGLDPIEIGGAIAVSKAAGVISKKATGKEIVKFLCNNDDHRSRIIRQGISVSGKDLAVSRCAVAGGEALLPYDVRKMKIGGLTQERSQGLDISKAYFPAFYYLFRDVPESYEKSVEIVQNLLYTGALVNSLGICRYSFFAFIKDSRLFNHTVEMINNLHNTKLLPGDLLKFSRQLIRLEEKFEEKMVSSRKNVIPTFFKNEENFSGDKYIF